MSRIVILPGHNFNGVNGKKDPGAYNPDFNIWEGEYTLVLRNRVVSLFEESPNNEIEVITFEGSLSYKTKRINALDPQPVLALELHFNASPSRKGRGHEVLKSFSKKSGLAAKCIDDRLDKIDYIRDRGEPLVGYFRQNPLKPLIWFLRATKCPAVVVEPIFIDNNDDATLLFRKHFWNDISAAIFAGCLDYLNLIKESN